MPNCDFCYSPNPTQRIRTEPYQELQRMPGGKQVVVNHIDGMWACCDDCAQFVHKSKWDLDAFLTHLMQTCEDFKSLDPEHLPIFLTLLRLSYRQLQEHQVSDPEPWVFS